MTMDKSEQLTNIKTFVTDILIEIQVKMKIEEFKYSDQYHMSSSTNTLQKNITIFLFAHYHLMLRFHKNNVSDSNRKIIL